MQLSVAQRIVLGFASIAVVILLSNASFLLNIGGVRQASDRVSQQAIPGLTQVQTAIQQINRVDNLLLRGQYSSKQSELAQYQTDMEGALTESATSLQRLSASFQQDARFSSQVKQLQLSMAALQESGPELLARRDALLAQQIKAKEQHSALLDSVDEASGWLLDLLDMGEFSDDPKLTSVTATANPLESALGSLVVIIDDVVVTEDAKALSEIKGELEFQLSDVNQRVDFLERQGEGVDTEDTLPSAVEATRHTLGLLQGQQSILVTQQAVIEAHQLFVDGVAQTRVVQRELQQSFDVLAKEISALADDSQLQLEGQLDNSWLIAIFGALISIALAIAVAIPTIASIKRPLDKVNTQLETMAKGDLSSVLDASAKDEFGQLSRNVNLLVTALRELIEEIASSSLQLGDAAQTTLAITQSSRASQQNQNEQMQQVFQGASEVDASAEQASLSAQGTAEAIEKSAKDIEKINQLAQENQEVMARLSDDVSHAGQTIEELHQNTDAIGGVLDVIRGVAEQTNLLALNAAIEAARAGEQGRGFAVVADEVRNLASRTQESTQEIQAMIEKLQQGAANAVEAMKKSLQGAELCGDKTRLQSEASRDVTLVIREASHKSELIREAASQQSGLIREINQKLEQVVALAEKNTQGVMETASASEQVSHLSAQMQASIKRFTH